MPEFLTLHTPAAALHSLLSHLNDKGGIEWVEISDALGRVTAVPVIAASPLPAFPAQHG